MPDIAMCDTKKCSLKYNCERHAASGTDPEPWQTYGVFTPVTVHGRTTCGGYWPREEKRDA